MELKVLLVASLVHIIHTWVKKGLFRNRGLNLIFRHFHIYCSKLNRPSPSAMGIMGIHVHLSTRSSQNITAICPCATCVLWIGIIKLNKVEPTPHCKFRPCTKRQLFPSFLSLVSLLFTSFSSPPPVVNTRTHEGTFLIRHHHHHRGHHIIIPLLLSIPHQSVSV